MKLRSMAAGLLVAFLSVGMAGAAQAQYAPSYAQQAVQTDEQIHGRILWRSDDGFTMTVQDDHGYQDNVQLHQGTIINPTGLTLAPGMVVSIVGVNSGSFFAATEIDTPYQNYGSYYGYQGHPWTYFGTGVALGFFFGNAGWWHGGYGYHPYWGGRGYYGGHAYVNNYYYHNVYRAPLPGAHFGGVYRGGYHAAAPPAFRGGWHGGGGGGHRH